jgi:hypothetical protein
MVDTIEERYCAQCHCLRWFDEKRQCSVCTADVPATKVVQLARHDPSHAHVPIVSGPSSDMTITGSVSCDSYSPYGQPAQVMVGGGFNDFAYQKGGGAQQPVQNVRQAEPGPAPAPKALTRETLGDMCGALSSEKDELLRENAVLRRQLERAERASRSK